jgi:hypothetical protein
VAARSSLLSGSVLDESGHVLAISSGSEARAIPTNEAVARGWAANAVIADEAQSLPPEFLLSALSPTLAAREGAFALLCGTAGQPIARTTTCGAVRSGRRHVLREAGEPAGGRRGVDAVAVAEHGGPA